MDVPEPAFEPFRIKAVEPLGFTTRAEREAVLREAGWNLFRVPADKVLNTIQFYGNTTAATVPLTIDYWRNQGKVKRGDRILSSVFGSGFTWGAAIFTI